MWHYASEMTGLTPVSTDPHVIFISQASLAHVSQIQIFFLALYSMAENFCLLIFSSRDLPSGVEIFNTFSICIFLKFVLFAGMQIRLVTRLHRDRRQPVSPNALTDEQALQSEVRGIYWKFYGALGAAIILIYNLLDGYAHWLILLGQLIWAPQILADAKKGKLC